MDQIKVTKTTATGSETSSTIDLELDHLPVHVRDKIKQEIGEFLIDQTIRSCSNARSPIDNSQFQPLADGPYRDKKKREKGTIKANLQFSEKMLSALDFRLTNEGIKIGVFGSRAPVADGHNNFSGASQLPTRQFLPTEGYSASIEKYIERVIKEYEAKRKG